MSRLLIDTSAYSAYFVGNERVVQEIQSASKLIISPIMLGELQSGFLTGTRYAANQERLRSFLSSPRVEYLTVDKDTSTFYATISAGLKRKGKPIPLNDVWIAASAMQHGLIILTLDSHFRYIDQVIAKVVE